MEEKNKHGVKLGLFIFIGLLFFLAGVLAIGNINNSFTKSINVVAIFPQVSGLQPGDNVWLSGVKVGTVKELQFMPNSDVMVNINLEKKLSQYIPKNALAKIGSDGLIGNKLIVIYSGDISKGAINTNDTLKVEPTITNEDMMATLQANNQNLLAITTDFKTLSKNLVSGEGSVGQLLTNDDLYNNLSTSVAAINSAANKLNTMSASLVLFTEKMNTDGNLANSFVEDTVLFSQIADAIVKLNEAAATAKKITENLETTTDKINQNTNSVAGVILNDPAASENLKQSLINLESSTKKLNENMEALKHNFLFRRYFKKQEKTE